jgi:hypothetical protein
MFYLIRTTEKGFGDILAKSNTLMAIRFHRNFMVKTEQVGPEDADIVEVSYDRDAKFWGFEPWVASFEGPEPTDPYTSAHSEQEALQEFINLIGEHHV